MGLLEGFGPDAVARLHTLEGSIGLLDEIHRKLHTPYVCEHLQINLLYYMAAEAVGHQNLTAVFTEVDGEATRTLLAQVVILFFAWDPLSLFALGGSDPAEFEERVVEGVAEMERQGRGKSISSILGETHALSALSYPLFCTLLRDARRPLAFLHPTREFRTMLAEGMHPLLPLDATIRERHATAAYPQGGEPWPRELLMQCPPIPPHPDEASGAIPPPMIDILRFTPEEVFDSFACGERVLEHVRTGWNWQVLEEAETVN